MPLLEAEPQQQPSGAATLGAHMDGLSIARTAADELTVFEENKKEHGLGFASPVAGTLLLANTLLGGSGMLGIPHAVSVAGWALGLVLIATFGCLSAFGSHLLQCSARRIGTAPCTFYTTANAVVPNWTWLIDGAVMIKCFGVGTSYLIIVGDLAPDALHYFGMHGAPRWLAVTMSFVVGGALASQRNLTALRYTAMCSVMIVSWAALLIVLFFARPGEAFDPCSAAAPAAEAAALAAVGRGEMEGLSLRAAVERLVEGSGREALPCFGAEFRPLAVPGVIRLAKALPVFIFGFTCQQNVFTICNEVRDASKRRVDLMIVCSYVFSGVAFSTTAILGYATYGNLVQSDVLKGYPQGGVVQFTRLLFALLATFSYPLQVHPSRASAMGLWTMSRGPPGGAVDSQQQELTDSTSGARRAERRRFAICTITILALSFAVALTVDNLGTMLGVVGATGSTMVSFILPGLCYAKTFPQKDFKRLLAFCQLGLGCVIMPVCLVAVFL